MLLNVGYSKDDNIVVFDGEYQDRPFILELDTNDDQYIFTESQFLDCDDEEDIVYLLDKYLINTDEFKDNTEGEFGICDIGNNRYIS